ncbi:MAG: di-heme-cytochrome C peroxidase [Pseudomonadota bacterium]
MANSKLAKWFRYALRGVLAIAVFWLVIGLINDTYTYWDNDVLAAAAVVDTDPYDTPVTEIRYLEQGWSPAQSLWFYNATQGSNLIPYDFFLHLEQPDSQTLFRDADNINRYRYLPQQPSFSNPDGLPVGMALDKYQGKRFMGFTCAACHTSQLNYGGVGIRIDGGPTAADMESFLLDLARSLEQTRDEDAKRRRFTDALLNDSDYRSEAEIQDDLDTYAAVIRAYTEVNEPRHCLDQDHTRIAGCADVQTVHYGYARLDAFGRIYNRVLEHVMNAEQLRPILQRRLPAAAWDASGEAIDAVLNDDDKTHLVQRVVVELEPYLSSLPPARARAIIDDLRDAIYNPANAPASYPFLWDISQHDFVQWTGLVSNAGLGPLGRNVGQVIGVFGTLDWRSESRWRIWSLLGGQGRGDSHINFQSSIDKRNLRRVESQLKKLWSPRWKDAPLPPPDEELAAAGAVYFHQYCVSCHHNIDRTDRDRRVIASMSHIDKVGTDPVLATNATSFTGYSGMLRHYYADTSEGDLVLQDRAPVAALVSFSTINVVATPDLDKTVVRRTAEWLYDTLKSLLDNSVKASLRRGDYTPATSTDPFAPLNAYKGRSLNGIWATAPYLHNGSIPTLYHLLLPKQEVEQEDDYRATYTAACPGEEPEYRPDTFIVGSREFLPDRVGFRYADYDGFVMDTRLPSNVNSGHEYAAGRTPLMNGDVLPPLCKAQRRALLEYLKTL